MKRALCYLVLALGIACAALAVWFVLAFMHEPSARAATPLAAPCISINERGAIIDVNIKDKDCATYAKGFADGIRYSIGRMLTTAQEIAPQTAPTPPTPTKGTP